MLVCRRLLTPQRQVRVSVRCLSVKELSWCAPKGTRQKVPVNKESKEETTAIEQGSIERFGVVAAMSRNRFIGINGKLPWTLPTDRQNFKELTASKILIIGRRTYEEESNECHVSHASYCIVVSTTASDGLGSENIKVAASFSEALTLAKLLKTDRDESSPSSSDEKGSGVIECWVAGGQKLFEEALQHERIEEVHLTVVDTDINISSVLPDEHGERQFAMFPAKYRWDRRFVQTSATKFDADDKNPLSFTTYIFQRHRPSR